MDSRVNSRLLAVKTVIMPYFFYSDLSHNERRAIECLEQIEGRTALHTMIRDTISSLTVDKARELISNLVRSCRDDRREMMRLLGFDLITVMNMKIYTVQDLNQYVGHIGRPYRIVEEIQHTPEGPKWLSASGFFHIGDWMATVWLDDDLKRYVRLSNGQLFICSNLDLTSLPDLEKINLRAILTGVID